MRGTPAALRAQGAIKFEDLHERFYQERAAASRIERAAKKWKPVFRTERALQFENRSRFLRSGGSA
ncbi:hypothetical protein B1812_03745 [Methylocystis bryophila]|uniref:Uncharacterized protein n=1 Tax=Methylocystis bryophila TaxID=655015 RepID=A0A1W6MRV8_9HYPH|nr:hypothetical protein B1812_03745 [Methylocystis bryophila]